MRIEASEQIDELPEDVAAAWASVLLDLWEKRQSHERGDAEQALVVTTTSVMEDEADGD